MHRDLNMSTKHVHVYYLLNMLFMLRPILFTIIKPSDPLIDTLYQLQKKKDTVTMFTPFVQGLHCINYSI